MVHVDHHQSTTSDQLVVVARHCNTHHHHPEPWRTHASRVTPPWTTTKPGAMTAANAMPCLPFPETVAPNHKGSTTDARESFPVTSSRATSGHCVPLCPVTAAVSQRWACWLYFRRQGSVHPRHLPHTSNTQSKSSGYQYTTSITLILPKQQSKQHPGRYVSAATMAHPMLPPVTEPVMYHGHIGLLKPSERGNPAVRFNILNARIPHSGDPITNAEYGAYWRDLFDEAWNNPVTLGPAVRLLEVEDYNAIMV